MLFSRIRTVRAKLTTLVAIPIVLMLATLPMLSWLLRRQLVDEVDNRVDDAEKSFRTEMDDDLSDLVLAARVLAADPETRKALTNGDRKEALALARIFVEVYPSVDIILADSTGRALVQVGCTAPPQDVRELGDLGDILRGREFRGVVEHGCELRAAGASPAMVIALPVKGAGAVLVCLPLDKELVQNAAVKLGLGVALVKAGSTQPIAESPNFPARAIPAQRGASALYEDSGTTWAVARFAVAPLAGRDTHYEVVVALDVGDVRRLVRQHLFFALGVLLFAAGISIAVGARLASRMSQALSRVNDALMKLANNEYAHVVPIHTGDELEDLATGFNKMVDGLKERDRLRSTLGKYLTTQVMEHLLAGKLVLGGVLLPVTVLFTDIRGFTSISEKMGAQELVGLLNEFFAEMVTVVMEEDGVVDKYIGDAIMAVFGAPVPRTDDALHAVRAAVRMRHALLSLNQRLTRRGLSPLEIGIGIHTGEVVAGNIGSEARMEYTVIGDAVNLASRLQSSSKDLGVFILISEDTYQLTKDRIIAAPVREITVKGRARPVMTYQVYGILGEPHLDPAPPKQ